MPPPDRSADLAVVRERIEVGMGLGYMFELSDGLVVRFYVLHHRHAAVAAAEAGERESR